MCFSHTHTYIHTKKNNAKLSDKKNLMEQQTCLTYLTHTLQDLGLFLCVKKRNIYIHFMLLVSHKQLSFQKTNGTKFFQKKYSKIYIFWILSRIQRIISPRRENKSFFCVHRGVIICWIGVHLNFVHFLRIWIFEK